MSWDRQRAYLDGLAEDESVPFRFEASSAAPPAGPQVRTGVDAGTDVIDLDAMRAGLDAGRRLPPQGR